LPTLITAKRH